MPPILDLQNTGNVSFELLKEKTKAALLDIIPTRYEEKDSEAAENALTFFRGFDTPRMSNILIFLIKETQTRSDSEEENNQKNEIHKLIHWWFTQKFLQLTLSDYQHDFLHSTWVYSKLKACHYLRAIRRALPSLESNPRIKELFSWWDQHPYNVSFDFLMKQTKTTLLNIANTPYEESGSAAALEAYDAFRELDRPPTSDILIFLARETQVKSDEEEDARKDKIRKIIHWGFTQKFLPFTKRDYKNNPLQAIWVHSGLKACRLSAIREAIPSLLSNPKVRELFHWWDQHQHQVIPSLKEHIKSELMPLTKFQFKDSEAAYNKIDLFNHNPVNTYLLSILSTPPFIPLYEWWIEKTHLKKANIEASYIENLNLEQPLSFEQNGAADFTFGAARVPEIAKLRKTLLLRSGQHIFSVEKIKECFRRILSQTDRLIHIMRELSFPEQIIDDTYQKIHAISSNIHSKENQNFSDVIGAANAMLEANRKKVQRKLDHAKRTCQLLAANFTREKISESLIAALKEAKKQNDKLQIQLNTLTQENDLLSKHFNTYKKWSTLRWGLLRHTLSLVEKADFNHVLYLLKEDRNIYQFLSHSYFQNWLSEISLPRLGRIPDSANTSDQLIKLLIVNARTDADRLLLGPIRSLYDTVKTHPGYLFLRRLRLGETVPDSELSERKRIFDEILPTRITTLIDWQFEKNERLKRDYLLTADEQIKVEEQTRDLHSLKALLEKVKKAREIQNHTLRPFQQNDDETFLLNTLFDHHQDMSNRITQEVNDIIDSQENTQETPFQPTRFLESILSKLFFVFHQVNWKEITINKFYPPNESTGTHLSELDSESSSLDLLGSDGASETSSEDSRSETSSVSTLSSASSSSSSCYSYKSTVIASVVRRSEPNLAEIFPFDNRENYFFKRYPIIMCKHHYELALTLAFNVGNLGYKELQIALLFHAFFQLETIEELMTNETLEQAQREEYLTRDPSRYSFFNNDPRSLLKQAKTDLIAKIRENSPLPLEDPNIELAIVRAQYRAAYLTR